MAASTNAAVAADAADAIRNVLSFCCGTDNTKVYIQDLLRVFDKRTLADDLKEIVQVTHPKARHLNGWHLERLALGEYGDQTPQDISRAVKDIQRDIRSSKALVTAMLEREKVCFVWNDRRDAFSAAKRQQQAAMAVELTIAKEIVHKMHVVGELDSPEEALAAILAQPAPVEARLLESAIIAHDPASITDDEANHVIDLSHSPSI
ncbi:hypothetical protein DYB37_010445 [Aphanomyces astaci]|uniref:Uncharacterized protein n=2 Tax=Aphanomyces astaci TaxID=112090 RepID=A0A3R6XPW0_APHAT|nr:hypothetical protein DYB35_008894 [Aphanomyces astaci]RHZ19164.1 hypothetical protein DYB37_010445 [Aphanomyces astaci]